MLEISKIDKLNRNNIQEGFDLLGIVSFDRPTVSKAGFNRIYTLTFEDLGEVKYFSCAE